MFKGTKMSHKYGLRGHVKIIYGLKNLNPESDVLHIGLKGALIDSKATLYLSSHTSKM